MKYFDRTKIDFLPLIRRQNKVRIADVCASADDPVQVPPQLEERISLIASHILDSAKRGKSVICAFGAHTIKNGLGALLGAFAERGWFTHLATNGAGIIHDWEFAFQGQSSEDVRANVQQGQFGIWNETGLYINLALLTGARDGLGYGESVGRMILNNGLEIPDPAVLRRDIAGGFDTGCNPEQRAASADLLQRIRELNIQPGFLEIKHPYAEYSAQAGACQIGVPFTGHPMFGHDIIYTHPASSGAAVGRTAERDFLSYAHSVAGLEGGTYLSVGSAVMSPMIFEKSLSMARNAAHKNQQKIENCFIHVADLQKETWDWNRGEPPQDNPAYYLRFMKTFNRMGCRTDYTCVDNRVLLTALYQRLSEMVGD